MFLTSLFSYSSTRSILSRASMRGAVARQRHPRALPASKPLHGDCNKWSAPSRVYPLTEQGFVPPGEGFASDSNNPVRKIIWSVPSRPEVNPRGPKSGGPPTRKIGWSATAQGCRIPRHQITCHSIWFELHCHFHLFSHD